MKFLIVLFAFCAISVNCFDNKAAIGRANDFEAKVLALATRLSDEATTISEKYYKIVTEEWGKVQSQLGTLGNKPACTDSEHIYPLSDTLNKLTSAHMECTMKISEITPPSAQLLQNITKHIGTTCIAKDCSKEIDEGIAVANVAYEQAIKLLSNIEECYSAALVTFKSITVTQLETIAHCISPNA